MTAHVISDRPAPAKVEGAWLRLSAALTDEVEDLAGRDDLTVTCTPGAGRGAPACFIPALSEIELDGSHLGHDPATCDPALVTDRERYPALWGALIHEAAHACHSRWDTPGAVPPAHVQAALLLEESRIEAAHLRRRPADRRWVRACVRQLVLADFTTPPPATTGATATGPASEPGTHAAAGPMVRAAMTPWNAGHAAALLLARVTAGVLESHEVESLTPAITDVLGSARLSALAALWHIAHTTADDDGAAMTELGRRWCAILATNPDATPPTDDDAGTDGETSASTPLAEAITTTVTAVATAETPSPADAPSPAEPDEGCDREAERHARERSERAARRVFTTGTHGHSRSGATAISGTRPPTTEEQVAARRLARHLKAAAHREPITTTTTSPTPPGRLRMRGALAADAQRAAGAIPTAEPFTRTLRRHIPSPPLRVGIACDVSASMDALAAPTASAAWILARAASHVPDAISATVIFGARVRPITCPRHIPARVTTFPALDGTEKFCHAVDALDATLALSRPGTARLLVIVSDGILVGPGELTGGQERITRLGRNGCAILWLALGNRARVMDGAHLVSLTDPAEAATVIGQAATRALRAT